MSEFNYEIQQLQVSAITDAHLSVGVGSRVDELIEVFEEIEDGQ